MSEKENESIWDAYAKTVKRVRPVAKKTIAVKKAAKDVHVVKAQANAAKKPPALPSLVAPTTKRAVVTYDRKVERHLRQGIVDIDAKLDLHGMTQKEAYAALDRFMTAQVKAGHRMVLVVTGKGSKGDGVLRSSLDHWLHALPCAAQILGLRPAATRHGGDGAFYVMLRRRKIAHD